MYAYAVYMYGVPMVATVDFDAPDQALIQEGGSRWLRQNAVYLRLEEGETTQHQAQNRTRQETRPDTRHNQRQDASRHKTQADARHHQTQETTIQKTQPDTTTHMHLSLRQGCPVPTTYVRDWP